MRSLTGVTVLVAVLIKLSFAATTYELEAKKFTSDASKRYYKLYNQIAAETYSSTDDEDFEAIFTKINNVKLIASELVEISEQASEFDVSKIHDEEIKTALNSLRMVGGLFVLGEDYFSMVLVNLAALKEISTDKDIEPYMGGAYMPNQDDSPLSYYPDIKKISENSNNAEELKYYWESWRDKNSIWASLNFEIIVDAFQNAAKILEVPVLNLWYICYNNTAFLKEMENVMEEIKPAYQQLHSFVRQELYKKYGSDVIDPNGPIPDHLFQQVLDQAWKEGSIIETYFPFKELPPYDGFLENFTARKIIDESERFYSSLGFAELDEAFYSDQLKEHDESENSGDCRANIFDLTPQVYMKYCNKVDFRKFLQTHGYMGRIHYAKEKKNLPSYFFQSYDVEYPVGEAVILSASTPKHLSAIGLAQDFQFTENVLMNRLFRMGIHTILNIPQFFVHTKVMNDLLDGSIAMDSVNKQYWKLMVEYAGVEPPSDRGEGSIDFPYKFYLDLEENHQTKKFVSEVLGYQMYRAFCKKSGLVGQLHNCDFYGNMAVGNDLKAMMAIGSSRSFHDVLAKVLPEDPKLSGDALLEYYKPILDWLKTKNQQSKSKIGWNDTKLKIL